MRAIISAARPSGRVVPPPSKSIAHRALLAAGLAAGTSEITGITQSEDLLATMRVLEAMGARITLQNGKALVQGVDPFKISRPIRVNCGESASTLRFAVPLLALSGQPVTLTGMGRLLERPMEPYQQIFEESGLSFALSKDELRFKGPLSDGKYRVPGGVSSQFFTGLLLALPLVPGFSQLYPDGAVASAGYVDLTIQVQEAFGVRVYNGIEPGSFAIHGCQRYEAGSFTVPADDSQAAFWAALGSVCGNVQVSGWSGKYPQPDRAILKFLKKAGASFTCEGDVVRFEKAPLHKLQADVDACPDLAPILMALSMFCEGRQVIGGTKRLAFKESDRGRAMAQELSKFGAKVRLNENSVSVLGGELHAPEQPLCAHGDHRVVMALTFAALAAGVPAQIEGAEAIGKSWPGFFEELNQAGADIRLEP